jgi:hypothetical protein
MGPLKVGPVDSIFMFSVHGYFAPPLIFAFSSPSVVLLAPCVCACVCVCKYMPSYPCLCHLLDALAFVYVQLNSRVVCLVCAVCVVCCCLACGVRTCVRRRRFRQSHDA